ncbi:MAG TPA: TonB-dependent receptor [Blastocatellia bacterium]|nr:TonB-dependent receptor [Blastocatellia bacterium]
MERIFSLLLILFFSLGASQRDLSVGGTTEDHTGAAIPGESLTLTNKATGVALKAVSDAAGSFIFKDVQPGEYILKGEAGGFKSARMNVTVGTQPLTDIIVRMEVSLSDEEVTIDSEKSDPVSPESNAGMVYLNSTSLGALPSQSQDVLSVIGNFLSPSALGTDGPSIVVDGAEGNDLSLPIPSLKQVSINKNPYSAEYRRPGSGRVDVVTRYGSRGHFDGSLSFFSRGSAFDARNAFASTRPDSSRRLFEGSLSGPAPFKRTRFFLSGSRLVSDQSAVVNALTLAGPLVENVSTSLYNTNLLGRVDVRSDGPDSLALIYAFHDQPERNYGVGGLRLAEQGLSRDKRGHKFQLSYNTVFSDSLLNVARFTFERRNERIGDLADLPAIQVKGAFVGGPSQTARSIGETRFEFQDIASFVRGAHTLRFGAGIKPRFYTFTDATNFGGTFIFSDLSAFAARTPALFEIVTGNPRASFSQHEAHGFFQDEMKLGQNLNLTLGLRYDWQAKLGDRNNFAPRMAIAYAPGNGKTVLRAGAGVFYDRLNDRAIQRSLLIDGVATRELIIADPSFDDPLSSGSALSLPPSIWQIAPGIQSPYLLQGSLSVERGLWNGTQLTVEYQTIRGAHLFRSRNINAPLSSAGPLPDPDFLLVRQVESSGSLRSNALITSFQGRVIKPFKLKVQYTLSRTTDDVAGLFDLPADNYDLRLERGRSEFDKRHRFNLAGILDLPHRFRVGSILTLASGAPFDITTGFDDNGDRVVNDRPFGVSRNAGRGPGFAQLDLRLTRLFPLSFLMDEQDREKGEFRNVELNLDVFNVLNRNNLSDVVGELSSPLFGRANASLQARAIQLSIRFNFRAYRKQ